MLSFILKSMKKRKKRKFMRKGRQEKLTAAVTLVSGRGIVVTELLELGFVLESIDKFEHFHEVETLIVFVRRSTIFFGSFYSV